MENEWIKMNENVFKKQSKSESKNFFHQVSLHDYSITWKYWFELF